MQEDILDPDLAICDPHHHLWHMTQSASRSLDHVPVTRYLLPEFLADLDHGHHIVSTVYLEAGAFYRAGVAEAFAPVGETEFANGVAAMSASRRYGRTRIAAGIVARADLAIGAAIEPVLQAHVRAGGGRLKGIRVTAAVDPAGTVP